VELGEGTACGVTLELLSAGEGAGGAEEPEGPDENNDGGDTPFQLFVHEGG